MNYNVLSYLLGSIVLLAGCSPEKAETSNKIAPKGLEKGYGFNATRNDWPKINDDATDTNKLLAENYFIIFDGSGSMSVSQCSGTKTKAEVAISAVNHFIDQIPAPANVGLLVFDRNGNNTRIKLGIDNRSELKTKIWDVKFGGGTPLHTAIKKGLSELEEQASNQLGYGEYNIVIVTDGSASASESPADLVSLIYQNTPVAIRTIGFCIGADHSLNQPGITYYKSADNPESLREGLASVLAESESFSDIAEFK